MKIFLRRFILLSHRLLLLYRCCSSKPLSAEKPFYDGKTLTVLINYAPGGPTDVEGQLLARHLARHVAGNPSVVVQNMAGAGGHWTWTRGRIFNS